MIAASPAEVTVKCRIGVDDQVPEEALPRFLETVAAAGVTRSAIHARKARSRVCRRRRTARFRRSITRSLVLAMKRAFPHLHISVNGGIDLLAEARAFLDAGLDGVMVGRAAYHAPFDILGQADAEIFDAGPGPDRLEVVERMRPHVARHLAAGGRLHQITRHMLGLFHGQPGARAWRRILSERGTAEGAGLEVIDAALEPVRALAA